MSSCPDLQQGGFICEKIACGAFFSPLRITAVRLKLQFQAKNHRKTKILFPFLTTNLQPAEIALHYFRRGWGHTSLIGTRMRDHAKKRCRCRLVKIALQATFALLLSRVAQDTVFFTGQQCLGMFFAFLLLFFFSFVAFLLFLTILSKNRNTSPIDLRETVKAMRNTFNSLSFSYSGLTACDALCVNSRATVD